MAASPTDLIHDQIQTQPANAAPPWITYYRYPGGNVGDDLNASMWQHLFPAISEALRGRQLVGIGTLITPLLDKEHRPILVAGSGTGLSGPPERDLTRDEVLWLRGPLSATALELDGLDLLDAAYLLASSSAWWNATEPSIQTGRVGFIPHVQNLQKVPWNKICQAAGLKLIDFTSSPEHAIAALRGCDRVLAEAMHGSILADAFGIPWCGVKLREFVDYFKWADHLRSVNASGTPPRLPHAIGGGPLERRGIMRPTRVQEVANFLHRIANDESLFHRTPTQHLATNIEEMLARIRAIHDDTRTQFTCNASVETLRTMRA